MMERIVGIDVGLSGALCVMTSSSEGPVIEVKFEPMPLIGNTLDLHGLAHLFASLSDARFFVEKVTAFKMGVAGAFKFGQQAGAIEAMLIAHRIVHHYVTPQGWQKLMHEGIDKKSMPDPKQRSLAAARRMFPELELRKQLKTAMSKFPDSGYVDALLICEYGRRISAKS